MPESKDKQKARAVRLGLSANLKGKFSQIYDLTIESIENFSIWPL